MAPLGSSSWSSAWDSIYRYSPLQKGNLLPNGVAAGPNNSLNILQIRPNIGQILMSKQVRYAGTAVLAVGVFFLASGKYHSLPTLGSLRDSGAATAPVIPTCPVEATIPANYNGQDKRSRFAYTQFVTNQDHLCNSVMIFETLFHLGSKADRVIMYPEQLMDPAATTGSNQEQKLLIKAREMYEVKLVPVAALHTSGSDKSTSWIDLYAKLLAFNQTQYDRVINLESDATVLQEMDELFLLPPCPVAMPRAYWLFGNNILSSHIMMVQPSAIEFGRLLEKMEEAGRNDNDIEIINALYNDQAMILPHRSYDLLTGEFRRQNHEKYLGSDRVKWDPVSVYNEAKFLHFSDFPVPKPWIPMLEDVRQQKQPKCVKTKWHEDCSARDLWNGFYSDFARRRSEVCNTK
ncbi:nucleotide-diphospho-sugar transferase [Pseudomassariella vexata]|uniref:Nucleotide-diphospho-sugar transferase n=1 Tax=Pseudomassariella vexata TaxID=1141098 RepID=A0A1Y2DDR1_9PEZI|nr:nucleotide-diphospho-sugar transferase [Pseudomassariella vexata]ORY57423.1 nucleotide-diphospho-sugar transferase [Pseudomassariella vexata]